MRGAPALGATALAALAVLGTAGAVTAEGITTRVGAAMLLELTAPRAADRDLAYHESLLREGPAPARLPLGQLQEDGSMRYGNTTVIVRNPCSPGSIHDEPVVLPGRRSK